MKKGKFNPVEVACIKGMVASNISNKQMGEQLDRSASSVEKEVERIAQEAVKDQMYIKTTSKGEGGIVVMTQAASSQVDERHRAPESKEKTRRSEWVHKIYEDK